MAKTKTRKFRLRNRQASPKQVWVLRYTHRHGTDVVVYASELAAQMGGAAMCMEEVENIEAHDTSAAISMQLAYAQEDYQTVIDMWGHVTQDFMVDTFIEIESTNIKEAVKNG